MLGIYRHLEGNVLKLLKKIKWFLFFITLLMICNCSTNPKLSYLRTDGITNIAMVPCLPKDTLERYYNKTINGEIYLEYKPSEEEEKVIRNKLVPESCTIKKKNE